MGDQKNRPPPRRMPAQECADGFASCIIQALKDLIEDGQPQVDASPCPGKVKKTKGNRNVQTLTLTT